MRTRIEQELALLKKAYPSYQHAEANGEDWFLLPSYQLPEGWQIGDTSVGAVDIAFRLSAAYPTGEPYAFLAPAGIKFKGQVPGSTAAAPTVPFGGNWLQFSWSPEGTWKPAAVAEGGSNVVTWARSFAKRFAEGA